MALADLFGSQAAQDAILRAYGGDDSAGMVTQRNLDAAAALVEQYLGDAVSNVPASILGEAVLRCAGWLRDASPAVSQGTETAGDLSVTNTRAGMSPLRGSGAMALLTKYKRRRARALAVE